MDSEVEGEQSTPRKAWRQTRRVRFWVKHSLTSLAHTDVFDDEEQSVEEPPIESNGQEEGFEEDSFHGEAAVCHNIDEAMAALHTLQDSTDDMTAWKDAAWKDAPQVPTEYDWILDGDPEWAAEFYKSQRLQQSLCQLELEDPTTMLDFDVLGRQENRFANFDDDFSTPEKEEPTQDDEFGDFVSAAEPSEDGTPEKSVSLSPTVPRTIQDGGEPSTSLDKTLPEDCCPCTPAPDEAGAASPNIEKEEEERRSVYKLYPLADVSSPESRFTRRRQLMTRQYAHDQPAEKDREWWCKSEQEIEEGLPSEYYSDAFDGTLDLLLDLPWEHVACWQENDDNGDRDISVVDEHVTQKLSELDAAQVRVKTTLLGKIQEREDMLQEGNELLHEMDHNLAMAFMYVKRGKNALSKAEGGEEEFTGIEGVRMFLEDADGRDQLRNVKRILDKCNNLLQTEQALNLRIESFGVGSMMQNSSVAYREYRQIIEIATKLREDADHDDNLARLTCLDPLRERSRAFKTRFRDRISDALTVFVGRCCHLASGFSSCGYEALLRAKLDLDANLDEKGNGPIQDSWSQCILNSLCYEADKCLARALLDPTLVDEECAESSYDKELIHLSFELNNGRADSAKLRTLTHNLVTIRFDFESNRNHLPWVYHKLCMLLADVLHTHYLLLQWHRTPFDQRNNDDTFLHRRRDAEIPEEKKTDECNGSAGTPTVECSTGDVPNDTLDESNCCVRGRSNPQHYGLEWTEQLNRIERELTDSKVPLWRQCESVLVTCLDQYLHFAAKKNFFRSSDKSDVGEKAWADDLERLHDVLRLTQQFLLLGQEFLGRDSASDVTCLRHGQESELREKLRDVFRKHLRIVHVEAMNSTGAMLFHESWKLMVADSGNSGAQSNGYHSDVNGDSDKDVAAKKSLLSLLDAYSPKVTSTQRCWENRIHANNSVYLHHLPDYAKKGNPFLTDPEANVAMESVQKSPAVGVKKNDAFDDQAPELVASDDSSHVDEESELYALFCSFVGEGEIGLPPLATDSAVKGLTKWSGRLITIMKKLPIILGDTAIVFSNLCDLYFTTVFRLCAGSSTNEKIILGVEQRASQLATPGENGSAPEFDSPGHKRRSSSSSIFNRSRRSSKTTPRKPPKVSMTAEADVCAPLPSAREKTALLREFLYRGQSSLYGIVSLEKSEQWLVDPAVASIKVQDKGVMSAISTILQRRQGAAWSCLFVAALLETVWTHVQETFVRSSYLDTVLGESKKVSFTADQDALRDSLAPLGAYVKSVVDVVPFLSVLASQMACSRAALSKCVIQDVVSVKCWGESTVHVDTNEYVHDLTDWYTTTWLFLSSSPDPLPTQVLDKTWDHLVNAAYRCVLDGFASVCGYIPNFPPEGIALMSMDVVAFESGMVEIGPRKKGVCSTMARHLVSQWITALYLPDEDLEEWILANHADYHLFHCLALIAGRNGSDGSSAVVTDMVSRTKALYHEDDEIKREPPATLKRYHTC